MAVYETEEEQVEALKKWWKEYGNSIIAGLIIGIAALSGWRFWTHHKQEQSATASAVYYNMLGNIQTGQSDAAVSAGNQLMAEFDGTPYAALAALSLAKVAVEKQDYDLARTYLEWALTNAGQPGISDIARVRLGRVMLAQGETEAALELIQAAEAEGEAFSAGYAELRGDIYVAMNKPADARAAYEQALAQADLEPTHRAMLQMKLEDL